VDMESLCVVAGKSIWAIRVDLHILDNGGYGIICWQFVYWTLVFKIR